MSPVLGAILFIFGAALGSFLYVVASRYDPDRFLLSPKVIGGRSRCRHCSATLTFLDLIPLLSFLMHRGRCRHCKAQLSYSYPLVELLAGLVMLCVPYAVLASSYIAFSLTMVEFVIFSVLWVLVFLTLLLISLIDIRLKLIPDEASIFLGVLGAFLTLAGMAHFGAIDGSFVGSYAVMLGGRENILMNRLVAVLVATIFFGLIIGFTRGRAMGLGDLKLGAALGLVFGWPDIVLIIVLAFILGAVVGGVAILKKEKTLRGFLPFGPFLAIAAVVVFFVGFEVVDFYFSLFPV